MQACFVSPEIFASSTIQLRAGGSAFSNAKMIINVSNALKFEVLICLFKLSIILIPEYSILINDRPINPIINGKNKLKFPGKKEVIFIFKNEYKKTSKIDNENKKVPK